jgi:hypothetical protein
MYVNPARAAPPGRNGRWGQAPALSLLGSLADEAVPACGHGLSRSVFIKGALRELCVAPVHRNASLGRSGLYCARAPPARSAAWAARPLLRELRPAGGG